MPSETAPQALYVDNVTFAYPPLSPEADAPPVLRGIRLSLAPGERALLLGRTGAGKTTLLLTTVGIVPQRTGGRFRGRVIVAGRDTRTTPVADLALRVGFLFQDPETQIFQVRVDDEVAFALENMGLPEGEIERRVAWALERVGLRGLEARAPATLSGGEKQRLALATVLAMQPEILVLDEPTANLDPVGRDALLTILDELAREGRTLFLATQEIDWGVRVAERAHVLADGALVASGALPDVMARMASDPAAPVTVPQVTQVCAALRHQGLNVPLCLDVSQAAEALAALLTRVSPARDLSLTPPSSATPSLPPPPSVPPVHVEAVEVRYPNGPRALRGVSLTLEPGEFVALVGANGAGKSTLARLIMGLLRPTRGRVRVGDLDTREARPYHLARRVGYVFQHPDHQIFAPTVWEEIAFGPRNLGLPEAEVRERVEEALRFFGLEAYRETPPAVLGFGLRRQVALAAILAMRPPILILDEPTGGLDPITAREVMARVAAFHRAGHTVLLITHDMRLVAEWAPRTVVLHEGEVLFDGPTRTLFRRPEILAPAHLTPPPITQLAQRLAPWGMPADVLTVEEFVAAFTRVQEASHVGRI